MAYPTEGPPALIPFVAATDDTALVELNPDGNAYIWLDGTTKLTRSAVTSSLTNGDFTTDLSGWTDASGTGASTSWVSDVGGSAKLIGTDSTDAVLYQTTSTQEVLVENGLQIDIDRGELLLKVGTSGANSTEYFSGTLKPGRHSFSITPQTGEVLTITLVGTGSNPVVVSRVDYVSGDVALPHGFDSQQLDRVRYAQSADVIFLAQIGSPQKATERRGKRSWSLVDFRSTKGPFGLINTSKVTLAPSGLKGEVTITASDAFFQQGHEGALFKIASSGQQVTADVSAEDNGTNNVEVTGVGNSRDLSVSVSGTWSGSVVLQRSVDEVTWEDIETYTTNTSKTYNDALDNSVLYYRLWVPVGGYTSGTIKLSLSRASGSVRGVARMLKYNSPTSMTAETLEDFGGTQPSRDWYEGEWSGVRGYPSTVELYEGRLWWAGHNKLWGSISDNYYAYDHDPDDLDIGDSAEIQKTLGFSAVEDVHWLKASTRLFMGLASGEVAVRSSSLAEVLTAANVNLKEGSNVGSSSAAAVKLDDSILFVQRYGAKLYGLDYAYATDSHTAADLSKFRPMQSGEVIAQVVATRNPEGRIWCRLTNGEIRVLTIDKEEKVFAWTRWVCDGKVVAMAVLPGDTEDDVFFVVDRANGYRTLEKKASYLSAQDPTGTPETLDFFTRYDNPGTTISGLDRFEGETVRVWADGQDRGDFAVSLGGITLPGSWSRVVVGRAYTATWISNKLGGFVPGSVLGARKRVVDTGLIATYFWPSTIKIGPDSASLYPTPEIEGGTQVSTTSPMTSYHELPFEFDGEDVIDPRVHIRATGPCMIQALMFGIRGPQSGGGSSGGGNSGGGNGGA